jgi:ribonucleoside-diphosphate reductase alpha chain
LFKGGSGAGTNLWRIRSSKEQLSGGGIASGPVSFMRGWDAFAGAIKSGGTTRRAAKMVILNADHPDVEEFINCKATEEKKAWALIDAGYNGGFNVPGGAYDSVDFQNANHSVRVTDEFMRAAENGMPWTTRAVTSGEPVETKNAKEMLNQIAEATHICGDPGLQYDTTINDWHTCANTDRIYASNPCSEFVFLDDTACNLASLNLMKFRLADGEFDAESFIHGCEAFITAQEIIVSYASYPTERIARNSEDYRPLGLGYANLGALLMAQGKAYDSDAGRALAGAITAIMTGSAYRQSARIAANVGTFNGYSKNREPMLRVIGKHRDAVNTITHSLVTEDVINAAHRVWDEALLLGQKHGYRNAQATVLAPTGTIAFMMDCDTTGIEPDIALVKYKKLVGGGLLKIVNQTVPEALRKLGYTSEQAKEIIEYIDQNDTIEGAPGLKDEHLSVFDCAFKAMNGTRSIHYNGHIKMMAAAQPFISGAISKTVNMPQDSTVDEIMQSYIESWKLGLKAVAIYRDGSKRTQPLSTSSDAQKAEAALATQDAPRAVRRKLPDERMSITHKFSIAGQEGYFTVGLYEDGSPGEIFIKMSKEGSTISGLMDSFAVAISMCLQYGVPLSVLVKKFAHTRFEPSGYTTNKEIPIAKSLMDYIFRWFDLKFHPNGTNGHLGNQQVHTITTGSATPANVQSTLMLMNGNSNGSHGVAHSESENAHDTDAPPCTECGTIMVRAGKCYSCPQCGTTSGCG